MLLPCVEKSFVYLWETRLLSVYSRWIPPTKSGLFNVNGLSCIALSISLSLPNIYIYISVRAVCGVDVFALTVSPKLLGVADCRWGRYSNKTWPNSLDHSEWAGERSGNTSPLQKSPNLSSWYEDGYTPSWWPLMRTKLESGVFRMQGWSEDLFYALRVESMRESVKARNINHTTRK